MKTPFHIAQFNESLSNTPGTGDGKLQSRKFFEPNLRLLTSRAAGLNYSFATAIFKIQVAAAHCRVDFLHRYDDDLGFDLHVSILGCEIQENLSMKRERIEINPTLNRLNWLKDVT